MNIARLRKQALQCSGIYRKRPILIAGKINIALMTLLLFVTPEISNAGQSIIVQSTTSTQNSGLFDYILPLFKSQTGISVHVVAVGTGQALKNGRNGDGDVLLVHAKAAEEKFVNEGYGSNDLTLCTTILLSLVPLMTLLSCSGSPIFLSP